MDVSDPVSDSLRAIWKHPKYVIPAIITGAPAALIGIAATLYTYTGAGTPMLPATGAYSKALGALPALLPAIALVAVAMFLVSVLINGMYVYMAYKWKSSKPSLSEAFRAAKARYKDLLGFSITAAAIELAVAALFLLPIFFSGYSSIIYPYLHHLRVSPGSLVPFLAIAVVLGSMYLVAAIGIGILLWLGPSIVVLDRKGAVAALKSSIAIGRGEPLRILAAMVIAFIVVMVILTVSSLLQSIPVLGIAVSVIAYIIISAFSMMVPPMYYISFNRKG